MHIHILGICGTFMGGVAAIAREAGHRVTGCDANVYPPMSDQLQAMGIELIEGWDPQQIKLGPDVFVVGNVVSRGNPLMEEILNRGLPYVSGPQWLADTVLRNKWVLAVAGTHGKTTTAAMLAWILEQAGLAPGFLIGGIPNNFGASARLNPAVPEEKPAPRRAEAGGRGETLPSPPGGGAGGEGRAVLPSPSGKGAGGRGDTLPSPSGRGAGGEGSSFFVIEADEYDTAFFDKRSKFVHYRPRTVILNNLEFDHADIFPDLAAIETQFHHLVRTVPGTGLLVVNGGDAALERVLAKGAWTPVERFGVADGWSGTPLAADRFEVRRAGKLLGTLRWDLLGEHNRCNALAALAAARHAGVPVETGIAALSSFRNVKRRLEVRGTVNGVTVYDDFAHHPTAIRLTLEGLRGRVDRQRILAVLEPRSNTMKLGVWKDTLAASLAQAERVFCYTANLGWDAAAALAPLARRASSFDDLPRLVEAIAAEARPGDHVLVMSNGSFGGIHEKLLARLAVGGARSSG